MDQHPSTDLQDPRELLEAKAIDFDQMLGDADEKLAEDSVALLGYQPQKSMARNQLRRALNKLKVKVYTPESVERYQKEIVSRDRPWLYRNPVAALPEAICERMPLLAIGMAIGSIVGIITGIIALFTHAPWGPTVLYCAVPCAAFIFQAIHYEGSGGSWHEILVKDYTNEIPASALHLAISVKRELPAAKIMVSEWRQAERFDPFLYVEIGGHREYFAVWDERDFRPTYQRTSTD